MPFVSKSVLCTSLPVSFDQVEISKNRGLTGRSCAEGKAGHLRHQRARQNGRRSTLDAWKTPESVNTLGYKERVEQERREDRRAALVEGHGRNKIRHYSNRIETRDCTESTD